MKVGLLRCIAWVLLLHNAKVPVTAQSCPAGHIELHDGKCIHSESDPQQVSPASVIDLRGAYNLLWRQKTSVQRDGMPTNRAPMMCSHGRLVPTTFLIGGTKAGTTSFFHSFSEATPFITTGTYLPNEAWWARKEKLFWSNHHKKGRDWYLRHYPECAGPQPRDARGVATTYGTFDAYVPTTRTGETSSFQVGIDMTANVFQTTPAPGRIREAFGALSKTLVFLIMIKGDPAQIARSSMYMGMREERLEQTTRNFRNRVQAQVAAAQTCEQAHKSHDEFESIYSADCARLATHDLRQAAYAPMLRHWLKYFNPGQFILISSEDFFANPQQIVSDVAEELGVPFAHDQVDFDQKLGDQKWNNNNTAKPKMQNENMEAFGQLQEYFKPLQHELSELLVKHVQHGDMKFIGNMTPFIHEI